MVEKIRTEIGIWGRVHSVSEDAWRSERHTTTGVVVYIKTEPEDPIEDVITPKNLVSEWGLTYMGKDFYAIRYGSAIAVPLEVRGGRESPWSDAGALLQALYLLGYDTSDKDFDLDAIIDKTFLWAEVLFGSSRRFIILPIAKEG